MPRAIKGQQKVPILKKTTGLSLISATWSMQVKGKLDMFLTWTP